MTEAAGLELRIEVGGAEDSDDAELEAATAQLRRELLELDVDDVTAPEAGPAPAGTRVAGASILGTLLVTGGTDLIGAIVNTVSAWIGRRVGGSGVGSVKLVIDGDSIEVSDPSAEDQKQLIQAFLARHSPTAPAP